MKLLQSPILTRLNVNGEYYRETKYDTSVALCSKIVELMTKGEAPGKLRLVASTTRFPKSRSFTLRRDHDVVEYRSRVDAHLNVDSGEWGYIFTYLQNQILRQVPALRKHGAKVVLWVTIKAI